MANNKKIEENLEDFYIKITPGENFDENFKKFFDKTSNCLLYTSPSPRDKRQSRMPSSA